MMLGLVLGPLSVRRSPQDAMPIGRIASTGLTWIAQFLFRMILDMSILMSISTLQMQTMLNSPQFLQQMSAMMSNPAVVDQIIATNPQLAAMGPSVRAAMQDEGFRSMVCVIF